MQARGLLLLAALIAALSLSAVRVYASTATVCSVPYDFELSSYLYADDQPTLLTDPSGLDPRIGAKTLNCKRNEFLCKKIYDMGYTDGCSGYPFRKTLTYLAWRGIELRHIQLSAQGKGKVIYLPIGPKGPGIYYQPYGAAAQLIKAAQGRKLRLGLLDRPGNHPGARLRVDQGLRGAGRAPLHPWRRERAPCPLDRAGREHRSQGQASEEGRSGGGEG